MQLILDIQPGRADVIAEFDVLRPWLEQPHVHLALDLEWMMDEGEAPGTVVGTMEGHGLRATRQKLARLVTKRELPPKLLIIHQFRADMIGQRV